MIFSSPLPEARLRKISIFADWVWGRYTPTSAGEQSGQMAFLYYRAKLALSKIARMQNGKFEFLGPMAKLALNSCLKGCTKMRFAFYDLACKNG
jgi:hypothetical protein